MEGRGGVLDSPPSLGPSGYSAGVSIEAYFDLITREAEKSGVRSMKLKSFTNLLRANIACLVLRDTERRVTSVRIMLSKDVARKG